jgi:hypothetical protein
MSALITDVVKFFYWAAFLTTDERQSFQARRLGAAIKYI